MQIVCNDKTNITRLCCLWLVSNSYSTHLLDLCLTSGSQTTDCLSPSSSVLCCRLHLPPAVPETCCPISFSRSFFHVFCVHPLFLWPCGNRFNACFAMLSSLLLSLCPSQSHSLLCWSSTDSSTVFLHKSLSAIMSV